MESEDLKRIQKEADHINGWHNRFRVLFDKWDVELKKFKKVVFSKELDCYMNGNDDCIEEINTGVLKDIEVSRKMEVNRMEKVQKCWSIIPFTHRPSNEFEWEVKTQEDLDLYKSFYNCSKPYYEQNLVYYQDKRNISNQINRKLENFKRGW